MTNPPSTESLLWDARARIMWGEKPEEIADWLRKQGLEQERIDDILQTCLKERDTAVRRRGLQEIIAGTVVVVICVGIVFLAERIAVWNVLGGFAGLYLCVNGYFKLFVGGKTHGSISDM